MLLCIKACHQIRYLKVFAATWAMPKDIIQFWVFVFFFPQTVIYACREQNDSVKLDIILVLQLVDKFKEYQCIISSVLPFQIS